MLHSQLKENTRIEHALLEKEFLERIRGVENEEGYADLLLRMYGYYLVLEEELKKQSITSVVPDYEQRTKCHRLRNDIKRLRPDFEESIVFCTEIPPINSVYSALGALYVLEGSTLGGQIIARILQSKLGSLVYLSFFKGYEDQTQNMWLRFKTFLEEPFTIQQREEIIYSAILTFTSFKKWLGPS